MNLRKAVKEDLPKCVEFLNCKEFEFTEGGYPNEEFIKEYLNEGLYIYTDCNVIIGLILGEKLKNNGFLLHCISIKNKNQGIGSIFLRDFEIEIKKFGIEWIILTANMTALSFYRKNNYILGKSLVECFKEL